MPLKKAYIILAHNNPSQVRRLIERLNDGYSFFFLHVDIKSDIAPFETALANCNYPLEMVKRENGEWGGLGIVKATLNALQQIADNPAYGIDYIHLMSGADYPIVSNETINEFFSLHKGKIFMEHFSMPVAKWQFGGMTRLLWYNFLKMQYYNRWKWYPLMIINKIIAVTPFKRKFPSYLKPFGGSQWWSITPDIAAYILSFVKQHPDYLHYHRHSLLPDESFFQTILLNTEEEHIKQCIVNDNLRYIDWTKPGVTKFPVLLTQVDYDAIAASGKFWARKFDIKKDEIILDLLDDLAATH